MVLAHMSRFAVTIPRNPTGPILHTITNYIVIVNTLYLGLGLRLGNI